MATKNGLVQIKDLIKNNRLTEQKPYTQGFLSKSKRAGYIEITLYNNRVYFYAKHFGSEFPFRNYRINRQTTLRELFEDVENYM